MRRPLPTVRFLLLAFLAGCTSDSAQSGTATTDPGAADADPGTAAADPGTAAAVTGAAIPDDPDCNFETPLVPGVPGSPGHLIPSERNPNGDSELAVLMRRFVDDLDEARQRLLAGRPTRRLYSTHRRMRCAWPTDPKERTREFDERAKGYLSYVRAFDAEPGKDTFNAVVAGCITCHSVSCRGPIERIEKLRL